MAAHPMSAFPTAGVNLRHGAPLGINPSRLIFLIDFYWAPRYFGSFIHNHTI